MEFDLLEAKVILNVIDVFNLLAADICAGVTDCFSSLLCSSAAGLCAPGFQSLPVTDL